jgi:putative transposase
VELHGVGFQPPERLREIPRAQRRSLAKPLAHCAHRYPVRGETMARAFQTGVYAMQEIADSLGVHSSTVSRAVRRVETGKRASALSASRGKRLECKTP